MLNGPEQLSRKLNMPVAYLNISRLKRGRYKARLDLICEDPSKLEEGEITRRFSSLLEAGIRANPSDWLWSHKRWKRSIEELKKTNI
jgi:KDO2-lipid IV(A) lauroyltransferase